MNIYQVFIVPLTLVQARIQVSDVHQVNTTLAPCESPGLAGGMEAAGEVGLYNFLLQNRVHSMAFGYMVPFPPFSLMV